MRSTLALRYHEHGSPSEVLRLEETELPDPGAGQVLVEILAAPINPSDLGQVAGSYAILKPRPAVAGNEGLGEVIGTGEGVTGFEPGDRVRIPAPVGTWRKHAVVDAAGLMSVPDDLPLEQAAMAFVNPPTAWRLLNDFVALDPGDWIVQNAATSAVGHYVIQLARLKGWKTLNLVRSEKGIDVVRNAGGDAVAVEGSDLEKTLAACSGDRRPRLGLNSVGGASAIAMTRVLAYGGALVTFGAMTGESVRFPTRQLVFNDLRMRGFWITRWLRDASEEEVRAMYGRLFPLLGDGKLSAPVAGAYPLEKYREALARAVQPGRGGKVLFVMGR